MNRAPRRYGGFSFDGIPVAVPLPMLCEVRPQGQLLPLPCAAEAVIGGVELRGGVVPVVDLARVLGRTAPTQGRTTVVIASVDGLLIGLAVDAVTGIFERADTSAPLQETVTDGRLYIGSVQRADTGAFVGLISLHTLAALPGLPRVELASLQSAKSPSSRGQHPTLLLRCGAMRLAVDALLVKTTLDRPPLHPSVLARGHCRGVVDYAGLQIAAVDLSAFCGLAPLDLRDPVQAFVIQLGNGFVALLVSEVQDVVLPHDEDRSALSGLGLPRPRLFHRALHPRVRWARDGAIDPRYHDTDGGHESPYLVLASGPLCSDPSLLDLAALPTRSAASQDPRTGTVLTAAGSLRRQVVTFEVLGEIAAPIDQVVEILPYVPQPAVFDTTRPLLGVMMDRGRSIPLFCLSTLAGLARPAPARDTCVLVVQSRQEWLGFVVPRLWAIEGLIKAPAIDESQAFRRDPVARALASRQSVVVAGPRGERILRLVDLHALAAQLQDEAQMETSF